jgi:glucosamine-6-phosphate deaminase
MSMTSVSRRRYGSLDVMIHPGPDSLAAAAAAQVAAAIQADVSTRGRSAIVLATGTSQLAFLDQLCRTDLDWSRISVLHLDEYVGIDEGNPASFRHYLRTHVVERVRPAAFHGLRGDAPDLAAECARYRALLAELAPAVCACGIGENGHLAFNDPPADLLTTAIVHEVLLDDACRMQQAGEGWFADVASVPARALSLTVPAILAMPVLVVVVPARRKAAAVAAALEGPITADCPASALRRAAHAVLHLEPASASRLR